MIRIVIQQLAIFLLPLLLYVAYLLISRRLAAAAGRPRPKWEDGPWYWLVVIGLVLTLLAFLGVAIFEEDAFKAREFPPLGTK